VRRLVDIFDSIEIDSRVIALVCRQTEDLRERCFTFQLLTETQDEKLSFLRTVCRHVANTLCKPDAESLLVRLGARDMSLDASDLSVSTLSKTFSSLHKTKQKVGRAFSFNKTPNKLKRAVSTMISPMTGTATLRTDFRNYGNNPYTPSESLRELRLESVSGTPSGKSSTPLSRGLQSCVNLGDSPRSSRSQSRLSPGDENKDPDFRTPNLSSRPSFRDRFRPRSGTFASFQRKSSLNQ